MSVATALLALKIIAATVGVVAALFTVGWAFTKLFVFPPDPPFKSKHDPDL